MADYDLKVITPDTGFTTGNFLFGADDQSSATPVPYTAAGIKTFMSASPTLVTPAIGTATGTSLALTGALTALTFNGLTITTTTGGVLTIPNSVTLTGPAASGTAMTLGNAETVTGVKTFTAAAPQIILGVNATTLGSIKLFGSTSGDVTVKAAAVAGTATVFQLPPDNGTNTFVLQTNGSGVTSWVAASGGGGSPGGSNTQVQFNDSSAFGGDAGFTYNKTTDQLAIVAITGFAASSLNIDSPQDEIFLRSTSGGTWNVIRTAYDGARFYSQGSGPLAGTTSGGFFQLASGTIFGWSSTSVAGTTDATLTRNAAGVIQFGTTTANASGSLLAVAGGFSGGVTAYNATGIPANGTTGSGFKFSSTANFGIFFGSSTPSLSAAKGSLYLRSDGSGPTDRAYINTDGGTTWTSIATAG